MRRGALLIAHEVCKRDREDGQTVNLAFEKPMKEVAFVAVAF